MERVVMTREERRKELVRIAALPNGINRLYLILMKTPIHFEKLPIRTLMIEAILEHEYPHREATSTKSGQSTENCDKVPCHEE